MRLKNPNLVIDPKIAHDYVALAGKVENVIMDFDQMRTIVDALDTRVIELGYKSHRPLRPVVEEQYYKWDLGLFVNRDRFAIYADLTREPVRVAQFAEIGYYEPDHPKVFNYWWTNKMDRVKIMNIDQPDSK